MLWDQGLTRRLSGALSRFLPHVNRAEMALTGGVAIDLHLSAAGLPAIRNVIADLDFVAVHVSAVSPTVAARAGVFPRVKADCVRRSRLQRVNACGSTLLEPVTLPTSGTYALDRQRITSLKSLR
jgi:hypothetical protein